MAPRKTMEKVQYNSGPEQKHAVGRNTETAMAAAAAAAVEETAAAVEETEAAAAGFLGAK